MTPPIVVIPKPGDCVTLYKSTAQECYNISKDWKRKERIDYPDGSNTEWFLFGELPFGHGWVAKIGRGDRPSNHYRLGGAWVDPAYRSSGVSMVYFSALYKYALHKMPGPLMRMTTRSWKDSRLTQHHIKNGWLPIREFKRGFIESEKVIMYQEGTLIQVLGSTTHPLTGLADFNDMDWAFPQIVQHKEL